MGVPIPNVVVPLTTRGIPIVRVSGAEIKTWYAGTPETIRTEPQEPAGRSSSSMYKINYEAVNDF